MGLSQYPTVASPFSRVGFIRSPLAEWQHCSPTPRLVTGVTALCFRHARMSLPCLILSSFRQRGNFLCRMKGPATGRRHRKHKGRLLLRLVSSSPEIAVIARSLRLATHLFSDEGSEPGSSSLKRLVSRNQRGNLPLSDTLSDLELGRPEGKQAPYKRANGIFWILLLNIGIYVADHWFQIREIKFLYLYHNWPAWYQFITATFCHADWNHLSSNLFFLYIFGKLVEEEEGNFALWLSYILTGAGANLVSWLVLPRNAVSVGASGAVFGLFAISVLVKMSWDWRKILEVLILGQFVIDKVMEAAQASTGLTGPLGRGYSLQNVNHIAHLSGALIGVALILLISRIPSKSLSQDMKVLKGNKEKPN